MTRDQLKKIIKECLVEILCEGVGQTLTEARRTPVRQPFNPPSPRVSYQQPRTHPVLGNVGVNAAIQNVTRDPIMSKILADTANTTLVEQEARSNTPSQHVSGDKATRIAAALDPAELISGLTGRSTSQMEERWARAAFAPKQHLPGGSGIGLGHDPYASFDADDPYGSFR